MSKRKILADLLKGNLSDSVISDLLEERRIADLSKLSEPELRQLITDIEADLERIDQEEKELERKAAADPEVYAGLMQYRQGLKEMNYLELLSEIETLERKISVLS